MQSLALIIEPTKCFFNNCLWCSDTSTKSLRRFSLSTLVCSVIIACVYINITKNIVRNDTSLKPWILKIIKTFSLFSSSVSLNDICTTNFSCGTFLGWLNVSCVLCWSCQLVGRECESVIHKLFKYTRVWLKKGCITENLIVKKFNWRWSEETFLCVSRFSV